MCMRVRVCMHACMYLFLCMYDVYEMTCEKTRNLMPVLLLSVAVSMFGDIQKNV